MKIPNSWLPAALLVAMSTMMFSCIVPVNTSMESARMLGAGFSSDFSKWAIRPEFGLLFFTGDSEGTSLNFGIGGTVNFGGN